MRYIYSAEKRKEYAAIIDNNVKNGKSMLKNGKSAVS